jgi:hypothetical protein
MVFCTIEEAWGNNFIKNDMNNKNYADIDLSLLNKNINSKTDSDNKNPIDNKKDNSKKKKIGGKKKNKKKVYKKKGNKQKIIGGSLISEDFDIFYYIIIGIILVILVDTYHKLGKNN